MQVEKIAIDLVADLSRKLKKPENRGSICSTLAQALFPNSKDEFVKSRKLRHVSSLPVNHPRSNMCCCRMLGPRWEVKSNARRSLVATNLCQTIGDTHTHSLMFWHMTRERALVMDFDDMEEEQHIRLVIG